MVSIVKDTHKLIGGLQKKGFTRLQAEGIAAALSDMDGSKVVGKSQLERALHKQTRNVFGIIVTVAAAQTALTVTLIELLA